MNKEVGIISIIILAIIVFVALIFSLTGTGEVVRTLDKVSVDSLLVGGEEMPVTGGNCILVPGGVWNIDSSYDQQVIYPCFGIYDTQVTISGSNIIFDCQNNVIFNSLFRINGDNNTIKGCQVNGGNAGFRIDGNLNILEYNKGIGNRQYVGGHWGGWSFLNYGDDNTFRRNEVREGYKGFNDYGLNAFYEENYVFDCMDSGFYIISSAILLKNSVEGGSSYGEKGFYVRGLSSEVLSNTASHMINGFYIGGSNINVFSNVARENTYGFVTEKDYCCNNYVENLAEENGWGFWITSQHNLFLENRAFRNDYTGMSLYAWNNTLKNNILFDNRAGLQLQDGADGTDLQNNFICFNDILDLFCSYAGPTTLEGDTCTNVNTIGCGFDSCANLCPNCQDNSSYLCGDSNFDSEVNVGDAIYLINYIFKGGPEPVLSCAANVNGDSLVNVGDAVYLINYVFGGGPAPNCVQVTDKSGGDLTQGISYNQVVGMMVSSEDSKELLK